MTTSKDVVKEYFKALRKEFDDTIAVSPPQPQLVPQLVQLVASPPLEAPLEAPRITNVPVGFPCTLVPADVLVTSSGSMSDVMQSPTESYHRRCDELEREITVLEKELKGLDEQLIAKKKEVL